MRNIHQAIIPLSGHGHELLSASYVFPHVMFPVFTRDGRCVPFVQSLVEDCVQIGIDKILLVTTPENDLPIRRHFDTKTPKPVSQKARADKTLAQELKNLIKICHHVEIILQTETEGDAQAVFSVQNRITSDRFLLLPSRSLFRSRAKEPCLQQFVEKSPSIHNGAIAVGLRKWGLGHDISWALGTPHPDRDTLFSIERLLRNSGGENLRAELGTPHTPPDLFPVLLGPCIATPRIFEIIATMVEEDVDGSGLFLLSEAIRIWCEVDGLVGVLVDGERFPMDDPLGYLKAAAPSLARNTPTKSVT